MYSSVKSQFSYQMMFVWFKSNTTGATCTTGNALPFRSTPFTMYLSGAGVAQS